MTKQVMDCILATLCISLFSSLIAMVIRSVVLYEALEGYSKSNKKKVLASHSLGERLSLKYLLKYRDTDRVRRAIVFYYAYSILVLFQIAFLWIQLFNTDISAAVFILHITVLILDMFICMYYLMKTKVRATQKGK